MGPVRTQPLDEAVALMVRRAHVIEAAVHDAGPWEIGWGMRVVLAERTVTDNAVTFRAVFEAPIDCVDVGYGTCAWLRLRTEGVAFREVEPPPEGDHEFVITWRFEV